MPFFIDWLDSPHPSASASGGVGLKSFRIGHPEPEALVARLAAIDVIVPVEKAPALRFEAVLTSPNGDIRLD